MKYRVIVDVNVNEALAEGALEDALDSALSSLSTTSPAVPDFTIGHEIVSIQELP